ncbi:MAG: Hsp20/alpha crystallin family protein [Candidatus Magnetobacterium sp. LHC-1]|uniref:Hsp20/alpha crystallin family protein n=1 Tax=Candidatus Magnetobacterium casense TaxID=1455061 RepID=A0ABS6RVF9_9BACT|nr:Hsp20/alpha crystallin family protein [Candidatus Magnetobacterium casensis]MBF0609097.1 Hsp20/alpha crystallin family protein [Nitrospirota bacterium]MBV6340619.1 Hsp20/alpha crystallin family protein [Candidatus Magnetobacterium casensis]
MAEDVKEYQKKEAETDQGVERTRARKVYNPLVDIIERNNDILVIADVPGVDETSVDITLEKNVLTITGYVESEPGTTWSEKEIENKVRLAYAEYGIGDYQRSFTLSDEVDRNGIEATVKDGVLRVVLPKAETVKTRKIEVKVAA